MPVSKEVLDEIALTEGEYNLIVDRLDREPNPVELGMFGALWSEHCGYKHSRPLLRFFHSSSKRVLLPPGEENAGAIDIGDGLAVVFKIESHNHPSAVEPFQGAATGVGGIVRDILAMGARPIALLNSLRFGPLSPPTPTSPPARRGVKWVEDFIRARDRLANGRPEDVTSPQQAQRNRYLFEGVVAGISWYGNCMGIPDVGGEIYFSPSYSQNPLVNALCLGLIEKDRLLSASVGGPGNILLLVGSETGRDGIHGASGLASRTFEDNPELVGVGGEISASPRTMVQVGNPFLEKILIESCLEAAAAGCLDGLQDLGAAGLTTASVEAAARGGAGIELDASRIHRRESGMSTYEVLLSESQERMLLVVKRENLERTRAIFSKWGIPCVEIGTVTDREEVRVYDIPGGPPSEKLAEKRGNEESNPVSPADADVDNVGAQMRLAAQLPINVLTDPPMYRLKGARPKEMVELHRFPLSRVPLPQAGAGQTLLSLLRSPNIASKESVYRQYDHQVLTNTVAAPGGDAAVLRVKGTSKGIAISTDGNGRYCYLDPYRGGAIAVAEACRNLSCAGAEPVALTDCLNFGNPENPEVYYQLEWCIRGMAEACRVLGGDEPIPVVSGNVSLYNETQGHAIYPTPVVGALGLLEEVSLHCTPAFKGPGQVVVLLGGDTSEVRGRSRDLAGSEYLERIHGLVAGRPAIDLNKERRVQQLCRGLIRDGIVSSAHDCSDGGLAVALAETCIAGGTGFHWPASSSTGQGEASSPSPSPGRGPIYGPIRGRWDAALFGEAQSRIIVSMAPEEIADLSKLAGEMSVPFTILGATTPDGRFRIDGLMDLPLDELEGAWKSGL